jgi:hypothetical protein
MPRFFKTSLILLALNALLFACFVYLRKKESPQALPLPGQVADFNWNNISKVEMTGPFLPEKRLFQKEEHKWYISQPIHWPANPYALLMLLNKLQFLNTSTILNQEDWVKTQTPLADYGLAEPRLAISIWEGEKKQTFALGDAIAPGKYLYVLSPDKEHIFRADKELFDLSTMPLDHFQQQTLFEASHFEIDGLRIKSEEKNLIIILSKEGNAWRFEAPIQAQANKALVEETLHELLSLRINRFLLNKEGDIARAHLHSPKARVTLLGPSYRQTLRIGDVYNDLEEYEAKLDENDTAFTIPKAIVDKILLSQELLRDRQFFKFKVLSVNSIVIEGKGSKLSLQKLESGHWTCRSAGVSTLQLDSDAVDAELINAALLRLKALRATTFLSDTPSELDLETFGLNEPQALISLDCLDAAKTLILGRYTEDGNYLYAKTADSSSVYEVPADVLSVFPPDLLYYHKRKLFELDKDAELKSLDIIKIGQERPLLSLNLQDSKEDLLALLPDYSNNQRRNLSDFIDLLKDFRVHSLISREFSETGLSFQGQTVDWSYLVRLSSVSKELGKEEKTLSFYFSKRLGGNLQIGTSPDLQSTFRLSQEMMDALFAVTFEKKPIRVEDLPKLEAALEPSEKAASAEPALE